MKKTMNVASIAMVGILAAPVVMMATGCSTQASIAAVVNNENIEENTITEYIENYRKTNGYENDTDWAQYLVNNDTDPAAMRSDTIDYFIKLKVIEQDAKSHDVSVSDDDVNNQLTEIKNYYGYDDDTFNTQLDSIGYTLDTYKEYVRQSLLQEKLSDVVCNDTTASDEDILTNANYYTSVLNGAKQVKCIVCSTKDDADAALAEINSGKSFDDVASEKTSTTDYDGWDVLVTQDSNVSTAITSLGKDQMTEVVEGSDGQYYIAKVLDVCTVNTETGFTDVSQLPSAIYDEFKEQVISSNKSTAFSDYVDNLVENANKTINDMPKGLSYDVSLDGVTKSTNTTNTTTDTTNTTSDGTSYTVDENGNIVSTTSDGTTATATTDNTATGDNTNTNTSNQLAAFLVQRKF